MSLAWGGGPPAGYIYTLVKRLLPRLLLRPSPSPALLLTCPSTPLPVSTALYSGTAGACRCEPHNEGPPKTSAPNSRPGALLERGPLAMSKPGGSRAKVGRTLPGHLRNRRAPPLAPYCPFLCHLACGHPCLLPRPIPGLKHTSRRWKAPRTPMSQGSVSPPPGLSVPGPAAVGLWQWGRW